MQCTYLRNFEARSCNYCCRGKPICITYSEYLSVALVIQHAKRVRCVILSSVAGLNIFPHYSINGWISVNLLNVKCTIGSRFTTGLRL